MGLAIAKLHAKLHVNMVNAYRIKFVQSIAYFNPNAINYVFLLERFSFLFY